MVQPSLRQAALDATAPGRAGASLERAEDGEAAVFISYSRRDMAFVDRLDADLRRRGVTTLIDRTAIAVGENWLARIRDLITRAETIVFVLSPDSVQSPICAEETAFGKRLGKRFIPVVARRVDNPRVPEALSELNYVFLDDEDTYVPNVEQLVGAIRTNLAWMRMHADLGRLAEEWSRAGRPRGLLLGTTRLKAAEHWIAHRPANAPLPTDDTRAHIAASHRAAHQRRHGLIGALVVGLVLALGLAALAFTQRQEAVAQRQIAERQTALALQRERDAQEQRDVARRNFDIAKATLDTMIFDLAQGLRQADGVRISVLRTVLSRVEAAMGRLTRAAPDDADVQRSRAVMLNEFGQTYLAAGDEAAARRSYEEALAIRRTLARRNPNNALWQRDLSVSLVDIGDLDLRENDVPGALRAFQEALAIRRALVRDDPDNRLWQRDLSVGLDRIGDLKLRMGDIPGALDTYREGLAIARALTRSDPDNAEWQRDLSVSLDKIGDLELRTGDVRSALEAHQEGLAIARALAGRDPGNALWQSDLSISLGKVGDLKLRAGDTAGALAAYEEGLAIARALARRDPDNTEWQTGLAVSLTKVASAVTDPRRKRECLGEALALLIRLEKAGRLSAAQKSWPGLIRSELGK